MNLFFELSSALGSLKNFYRFWSEDWVGVIVAGIVFRRKRLFRRGGTFPYGCPCPYATILSVLFSSIDEASDPLFWLLRVKLRSFSYLGEDFITSLPDSARLLTLIPHALFRRGNLTMILGFVN